MQMQLIRRTLDAQGRKVKWLAGQTGVSERTLLRYFAGDTEPERTWLEAAARVLGCDPEDFFAPEQAGVRE